MALPDLFIALRDKDQSRGRGKNVNYDNNISTSSIKNANLSHVLSPNEGMNMTNDFTSTTTNKFIPYEINDNSLTGKDLDRTKYCHQR